VKGKHFNTYFTYSNFVIDGANAESLAQISSLAGEIEKMKIKMAADDAMYQAKISYLEKQLSYEEMQNRTLRGKVAELKGNIRVFARVRPFLADDGVDPTRTPNVVVLSDGESLKLTKTENSKSEDITYRFDKSFGPTVTQSAIFDEVSEFVQSALDGFNGALLYIRFY
jgi:kinesin family protein C1